MAYPPAPQYPQQPAPGPRTKPGSVTAVVWTQFLTAALLIITAISMFAVQSAVEDAVADEVLSDPALADAGITASDISTLMTIAFAAVAAVYLVFAVFYVVLGLLNNRGNRPGRILSWILSGIGLLCCGMFGLIGKVGETTYTVDDTEYQDEMTKAVEAATPAWVNALDWITLLMFIVGSLIIIILLAVPASNEFFRKPDQGMGPYPGQPGQPPYGQQPPPPPQPPFKQ